ncbi:MAG TPA: prevent-host-death protein [Lactobacillus sp.]|nr:prevent-host-death protein [Lactobacillus sp.]
MKASVSATSVSDFRKNFKAYADDVSDLNEPLIITRPKQKNVILISEQEYNSLRETNYLLATTANRKALQDSLTQLNRAEGHTLTPKEWEKLQND